jgi:rubrerythrin
LLERLAEQERRHPSMQAAWLLEMALLALTGGDQQAAEGRPGREVRPCDR